MNLKLSSFVLFKDMFFSIFFLNNSTSFSPLVSSLFKPLQTSLSVHHIFQNFMNSFISQIQPQRYNSKHLLSILDELRERSTLPIFQPHPHQGTSPPVLVSVRTPSHAAHSKSGKFSGGWFAALRCLTNTSRSTGNTHLCRSDDSSRPPSDSVVLPAQQEQASMQ